MGASLTAAAAAAKLFQSCLTLCNPRDGSPPGPPSLGFSRQEHWSGLPFPSQCMKVKSESEVAQLCLTLSDPMDCSLPGSSVHGIFQARVLEWGTIAFSNQPHRTGEKRDFILKGCSQTFMCIGTQGKSSNLIGAWAKATCWPWGVSWRGRGS